MRLTIEPTQHPNRGYEHATVVISHPRDDLHIAEVVKMLRSLLVGFSYSPKLVDEYVPEPEE